MLNSISSIPPDLCKIGEKESMGARRQLLTVALSACFFLCSFSAPTGSSRPTPICRPSSCGNLHIRDPFRLAGDPESCGGTREFELTCEGNRTVLNWLAGRYYVLKISYESQQISVVDANLASGSCSLPSQSVSLGLDRRGSAFNLVVTYWASFVNCSRIIDDAAYEPVACMSKESIHVYVVHGVPAFGLQYLQPSCRALSVIPLSSYGAGQAAESGRAGVAQALQMGFEMYWTDRRRSTSKVDVIGLCFRRSFQDIRGWTVLVLLLFPPLIEGGFFVCLLERGYLMPGPKVDVGYRVGLPILLLALHLIIVLFLVGRFVVAPLTFFVLIVRKFKEERSSIDTVEKFLQNQKMLSPARYSYPEILSITNHFEKKLGQGGFGSVYLGKLPGDHSVAVKMLSDSKCDGEDFISEVSTIGRIHHTNVMRLNGFCSEGAQRALIYEYMPNGSLDKYIFTSPQGANSPLFISWEKLHEIALGIARGIEYLHGGCDMRILHFDIKPQNILLDRDFTPKVSDFGLARLYPKDYSLVSVSVARGTIGYIAPELVSRNFGMVSDKSDVYSFGMLLLEMAGSRKKYMDAAAAKKSSEVYFPVCIYDQLAAAEGRVPRWGDVVDMSEVERKLCMVGLWCIQMKSQDRPSMSRVVEMLEESVCTLQMPPKPFFCSPPALSTMGSSLDTCDEELSVISEV